MFLLVVLHETKQNVHLLYTVKEEVDTTQPVARSTVETPDIAIIKAKRLVTGLCYRGFRPSVSISVSTLPSIIESASALLLLLLSIASV